MGAAVLAPASVRMGVAGPVDLALHRIQFVTQAVEALRMICVRYPGHTRRALQISVTHPAVTSTRGYTRPVYAGSTTG